MNNFMNITLIGEKTDLPCNPTKTNMVIKTKYNGFKIANNSIFDDWVMGIVFPDAIKAQYFLDNFKSEMMDFREGMVKDNYVIHILHFKFPKPETLYADQIQMKKDLY